MAVEHCAMIRTHSGRSLAAALSASLLGVSLLTGAEIRVEDFEGTEMRFSFFAGDEFPGAKGRLVQEKLDAGNGKAARLDADFAGGGVYVQMGMDLDPPIEVTELRFRFKTRQVGKVRLRISDSTGQVHQQLLPAPASGNWQDMKVTQFTGGEDAMHWGGANDGVWHSPATGIAFLLEKDQLLGKTGTLWLDDVRAAGSQVTRLELAFLQQKPGNVFLGGEPFEWSTLR